MTRSTHLLVVTTNYAESHGGVEEHLQALLPRLVARGVRVTLGYLGAQQRVVESGELTIESMRRRADVKGVTALPDPRDWRGFSQRARRAGVTHVSTHTRFFLMSWLGVQWVRRAGVPVLHTEHGAGHVVTESAAVRHGSLLVDRTMGRQVLRRATEVLAVSEQTAAFVRELSGRASVPFGNGVDLTRWMDSGDTSPPDAAPEPRQLVFVGRVVAEKGWRDFLDVVRAARDAGHTAPAHLVGDGPELAAARMRVRELGLDHVVLHGRCSVEQMRPLLDGAVYVNPSVAAEGFQLTQVEAAAAGAAVVTYDVGVARELERSGAADVTVVPRGDLAALTTATTQAQLRVPRRPDRGGLTPWDWETLADRYVKLLHDA
ncbi:glycosyltransferase family 4 protein [Oryzihumus sp.]